jgi:hypothetical protein
LVTAINCLSVSISQFNNIAFSLRQPNLFRSATSFSLSRIGTFSARRLFKALIILNSFLKYDIHVIIDLNRFCVQKFLIKLQITETLQNEFPPAAGVDEEGTEELEVEGCGPLDSIVDFG